MPDLPRVKSVRAGPNFTLSIAWKDGSQSQANLTGLVHSSEHFAAFSEDRAAFRRVKPVAWGDGIEWDNGLDYSANALRELSDEQQPMKGAELRSFALQKRLNTEEFAELLGCTARTVRNYYSSSRVPRWVAMAVRNFQRDDTVFAAHYRPVTVKPRGRPKTVHPGH